MLSLLCCLGAWARRQAAEPFPSEPRVSLAARAAAYDAQGHIALTARLRTPPGGGKEVDEGLRLVVENRNPEAYRYVSGRMTFYGADGVRCGGAAFALDELAMGEEAEVQAEGLRLTCHSVEWRVVATSLLTWAGETAR